MGKEAWSLSRAGWDVVAILAHNGNEMVGDIRVVGVERREARVVRIAFGSLQTMFAALRERADVYHFHDLELIPIGLLLRVVGKTVVYDVHETNWATVWYKSYLPRWVRPLLAWIIRHGELAASRYFSGIVAATPKIAEQFSQVDTPCVTVQNFPRLDQEYSSVPLRNRSRVAIYAGVISEARGLLTMIEAVSLLPSAFVMNLVLAGPIPPQLLVKARTMPGWHRVVLKGAFRATELPDLLSDARIGLVLLHPMNNYIESYPTKMFEYMAAGLPVIASDFPLWRSILGGEQCGLLVDPLSPNAIAKAMEYLLVNEDVAETMGARARVLVRTKYNWMGEARKLVAFYDHLCQAAGSAHADGAIDSRHGDTHSLSQRS